MWTLFCLSLYRIGNLCRHFGNVFFKTFSLYANPCVNKKEKCFNKDLEYRIVSVLLLNIYFICVNIWQYMVHAYIAEY